MSMRLFFGRAVTLIAMGAIIASVFMQVNARQAELPAGLDLVPPGVQLFSVAPVLEGLYASDTDAGYGVLEAVAAANLTSGWTTNAGEICGFLGGPPSLKAAGLLAEQPAAVLYPDPFTMVIAAPVSSHEAAAGYLKAILRGPVFTLVPDVPSDDSVKTITVTGITNPAVSFCDDGSVTTLNEGAEIGNGAELQLIYGMPLASVTIGITCSTTLASGKSSACHCRVQGKSCDVPIVAPAPILEPLKETMPVELGSMEDFTFSYQIVGDHLGAIIVRSGAPSNEEEAAAYRQALMPLEPVLGNIGRAGNIRRFTSDHTFWSMLQAITPTAVPAEGEQEVLSTVAVPESQIFGAAARLRFGEDQFHSLDMIIPVRDSGSVFSSRLLDEVPTSAPHLLQHFDEAWMHVSDVALSSYADFTRRYLPDTWNSLNSSMPPSMSALLMALEPNDGLKNLDLQIVNATDGIPGVLIVASFAEGDRTSVTTAYLQAVARQLHIAYVRSDMERALQANRMSGSCDVGLWQRLSAQRQANYREVLGNGSFKCPDKDTVVIDMATAQPNSWTPIIDRLNTVPGGVYLSPLPTAEEVSLLAADAGSEIDQDGMKAGRYRVTGLIRNNMLIVADREQLLLDVVADLDGGDVSNWPTAAKLHAHVRKGRSSDLAKLYPDTLASNIEGAFEYASTGEVSVEALPRADLASMLLHFQRYADVQQ